MKYQIVRLVEHDGGYAWRPGEEYETQREAMLEGEADLKEYRCMMYQVYRKFEEDDVRLVWQSATPLVLKAHP